MSLNCETDFVAKNEEFVGVAQTLVDLALSNKLQSKEALMEQEYPGSGVSVAEKITEQIGKIGEKIEVAVYHTMERFSGSGVHPPWKPVGYACWFFGCSG